LPYVRVYRNELESVYYMNQQEIKTRLERALHGRITPAEWMHLEEQVDEYSRGHLSWQDFRDLAAEELSRIRAFYENKLREQAGVLEEEPHEDGADRQPPVPVHFEDRTLARYSALDALNNLRSGGSAPPRATMTGTLLPRGGMDGTVPQWVWVMAAELWVPAEDVAESFRAAQRNLMDKPDQPRTQARAFEVARFVWEVVAARGKRPSWPELCKLWNNIPMTTPFEDWRDFRTNFVRGEKATLPRYTASAEQITEQVREATSRGEAVAFDRWVSQVRAATVQQDPGTR
jgi:hypothetical protein